jgi:predicted nicotinamide N-methyase
MDPQYASFPVREIGADPAAVAREIADLGRSIERYVTTRDRLITLPYSGQRFTIRSPAHAGHERFFANARATTEKQLPYWVDIWPSGVALADLALSQADDLAGKPVLELGCGLGVTATAALAAGADLYVADYAPLSLAFCRLNALRNVDRAPRPLAFNWREPLTEVLTRLGDLPQFPIILAADILYERRDIAPVLALIERLLAPDGQLWLTEPGRQTARAFLNALTAAGWHDTVEQFDGPWPGDQKARVRYHILQRSASA